MTSVTVFGPSNGPVGSITWFPPTSRPVYNRDPPKWRQRNPECAVSKDLIGAIVALVAWFVLTFVIKTGLGLVHALLAAGVVLLIRWWALRYPAPDQR